MRFYKSILSLIVAIVPLVVFAQYNEEDYCDKIILKTPKVLGSYGATDFMKKVYSNKIYFDDVVFSEKIDQCWVVYSDRSNNEIYSEPDGFVVDKLNYLDKCFVTEFNGFWLKIVNEKKKSLGWIKASNLILTRNTLLDKKSSTRKAMILMSQEDLQKSDLDKDNLYKKFYKRPSKDDNYLSGKEARNFDIYFILKETEGSVLLARNDKVGKATEHEKENILGWIQKAFVTYWDHKVCLENSNFTRSVKAYESKIIPIYRNKTDLQTFLNNQIFDKTKVIKESYLSEKLADAYEMRMPIINNIDSEIKHVASISRLSNDLNNSVEANKAEVKRKIIDIKQKMENVDVMFVIDGTKSMTNYYSSISRSVMNVIELEKRRNAGNKLRFGLTIYRDYPDGVKAVEVLPLTSDHARVISKLETTVCGSKDLDLPEAVYNGIIEGVKGAGFNPHHNNVVVVIGDAGNHEKDKKGLSLKNVVNQFSNVNANLVFFQVNYLETNDGSFDKFNFDAQDILIETASENTPKFNAKLDYIDKTQTWELNFESSQEDKELFMFGKFTHAELNVPMDNKVLETNIENSLADYLLRASKIRARLEGVLNGTQGNFSNALIEILKKEGMSDEQIEILKMIGDFTARGYTSMSFYDLDYDAYSPVVFLSFSEKKKLDKILGKLKGGSNNKARKNFQLALLEQCKDLLGETNSDLVLDKTMNEIWDIVLGVPFDGNFKIKNLRLRDLDKSTSIDDIMFKSFLESFIQQANNFTSNPYNDRKFRLADEWFYWIPLEDFPGN